MLRQPEARRVCVMYTGGTIGMRHTVSGLAPAAGYLEAQLTGLAGQPGHALPGFEIQTLDPLLDSASMAPADWLRIAREIEIAACGEAYDGFVVIHGTDTMAYTASALAFLLGGLGKPVILTGAMLPFDAPGSDALPNMAAALSLAARGEIAEVCVYFGGRLLRGCRAVKVSARSFVAFDSPHEPPLGESTPDFTLHRRRLLPRPPVFVAPPIPDQVPVVGLVRLFPGIPAHFLEAALQPPLKGLVLETYGKGSCPDTPGLIQALEEAARRGVVIVSVTQCREGSSELDNYHSGLILAGAGVIRGQDMTAEAALAKLFTLLAAGHAVEAVRALMQQNLCGEMTGGRRV